MVVLHYLFPGYVQSDNLPLVMITFKVVKDRVALLFENSFRLHKELKIFIIPKTTTGERAAHPHYRLWQFFKSLYRPPPLEILRFCVFRYP